MSDKAQHLTLYRKYRPMRFEDIVGQDHIIKVLQGQVETGALSHAYLFSGTRGTGKTSSAKVFAKAVNCLAQTGKPCGKCEACKQFATATDIIEIDAASNNGVDEIRVLRENIKFTPMNLKYKIYIIDEVHMLTGSAFNALLKTLEEPPAHAIFILATTEPQKLPATILSRCIKFTFRLISENVLQKFLEDIFKKEGIPCEKEAANLIAQLGEGSARDALTIADMCASFCDGKITFSKAREVLSCVSFDEVLRLAGGIAGKNTKEVFDVFYSLSAAGKGSNILVKELVQVFKNVFVAKNAADANKLLLLPPQSFAALQKIAGQTENQKIVQIIETLLGFDSASKQSQISPDILFEATLVRLLCL